uniref:Cadherin domain-containing protein n=1 Tax=Knipowitschia caucasica TaxID=637954 RepID=A0AAV2MJD6_KNICA
MSEYSDFTLIKPSSTSDFKEVISVLDASLPDSTWTFESQQIVVQAKDQGSPSLSSNATVHVFILDLNDNAPAVIYPSSAGLGSLSLQRMPRSAKAAHLVTKVTAVDADSGHNAWISYKVAEATDASLFTVNQYTGEVRTKRAVAEQDDSSQRLLIEIRDDGDPVQSATVTVSILMEDGLHEPILDIRHKAAESSGKTGRLALYLILSLASVSVLSLVTFLILAVKCVKSSRGSCCVRHSDCDDYKNPNRNLQIQLNTDGPIKYVEVLGGDMMSQSQSFRSCMSPMSEYSDFTLIKPSSTSDFKEVISVLDASLPDSTWTFESQQIMVQAKDQGSPSLSSNATVHVFILDLNDNAPAVIYPSSAGLGSLSLQRMPRSAKAAHLVTKVTAVDADSGHNAWISYKVAEATDASLFTVNQYTGEVRTKRAVVEQDDSSQRLLIEIRDDGDPVQSATVTVSILMEDGLHEPILDIRHKAAESSGKTGRLALYLILSLASVSVLSLVTFLILAVKCVKSSRGSCCVRHSDCDDYKNPNRNLQIQLNTDGPIKYVEVLGGDMMSQSQSFRSCMSPMSEYSDFTLIKPSSTSDFKEVISVLDASLPDSTWTFESQQIMVQAKDQGSPSLSSNATVHVFILDLNDNAPAVIYPSSAGLGSLSLQRMPRSAKAAHLVTKVTAVDADSGHNAWISYKVAEATDASLFTVNQYTGEVRTKRAVVEQDDSSQRLLIEIRDDGDPVQSATVTVSILMEDGLHEPILDIRHKAAESSGKTGRLALYLILSLASVSVLSLVTFLILAVKCVKSSRGSCCVRHSDCDDYKNPNRNLQIQLNTDGPIKYVEVLGGDMMSQSQSFRSCMSPMSEYSDFTLIKPSSTSDFKEVISVLDASLPDSTWTFESQQIMVQAKDQGSPSLSSNATVHVFILDLNDNAPAVIYPSSAGLGSLSLQRMPRTAKAAHLVTKVTAVDADSGHNAWISYKVAEATDASLFTVNQYTGEVRTKRAVVEQDDSSQRLLIEIRDDGDPVQSATVTVSILMEDGLHEPILDIRHKAAESSGKTGRLALYLILSLASVSVLSLVTFLILAVKCVKSSRGSCCVRHSDCDDYKNPNRNLQIQLNTDGPIKYVEVLGGDMMSQSQSFRSCMSPMSEYSDFTLIKPSSTSDFKEVISVLDASLPDSTWTFESQQAKDQGSPSLSSNATVHVFILDLNDNAPAVIYPSSAGLGSLSLQRMPRSAKAAHLVTKVTAVDADSGHNAWISYKVAEATDASLFTVNQYTGEVRTKRAVVEQDDSSQRLLIEIRDDGDPVQSATVTVSILMEDGLHEPILDIRHKAAESSGKTGRLALYLILSLASVSVLSLVTFLILAVKCVKSSRGSCCVRHSDCDDYKNPNRNLQIQLNTDGPIKYVEVLGGDMMSQSQSFRSCMSPMSEYSDFTLIKPSSTSDFKEVISVLDASLPDSTWTFESQQVRT